MKDRIVAESLVICVTFRSVAERYGLKPNHVPSWRRLARADKLVVPVFSGASFATVLVADALPQPAQIGLLVIGGITLLLDAATLPFNARLVIPQDQFDATPI